MRLCLPWFNVFRRPSDTVALLDDEPDVDAACDLSDVRAPAATLTNSALEAGGAWRSFGADSIGMTAVDMSRVSYSMHACH